jgi:hypothetical protein
LPELSVAEAFGQLLDALHPSDRRLHSLDHLHRRVLALTGGSECRTPALQATPVDLDSQTRVVPARVTARAHRLEGAQLGNRRFLLACALSERRRCVIGEPTRLAVYRLLFALSLRLGGPTPPEHG